VVTKAGEWTLLWAELSASGTGTPGTLTGLVLGTADARVSGARVDIMSGPQDVGRSTTTDDSGSYTLDQLQPGEYALRVTATGYETYNSTALIVDADKDTRTDFHLLPTGSDLIGAIAGVVRDDVTLAPLEGVDVRIIAGPHTDNPIVTTDAQGSYELAQLSPGTYTVRFSRTGYQTFTTPGLAVTGGTTASYDVILTPSGT
jgi:uncharacterized surface anchored protein